ncbi:UNVERIFIED_CONTAM: hypothetical protein GTU68_061260, partial [Idotea baltica]|nr:hypothetical protein [Idotea baltica]
QLNRQIEACVRCPRLLDHCERIATEKRRAYADFDYWGRPVPNFGDPKARLLIVGLAPGAHGANRTGRMFTGDRSGDWLFAALHKVGFANQAKSTTRNDGLILTDCAITGACHCAPPLNKPTSDELNNCFEWFESTVELLPTVVVLALGQIGWKATVDLARKIGWYEQVRRPKFGHGAEVELTGGRTLLGSYHPSQQNTFTGRLTKRMFNRVLRRARTIVDKSANE